MKGTKNEQIQKWDWCRETSDWKSQDNLHIPRFTSHPVSAFGSEGTLYDEHNFMLTITQLRSTVVSSENYEII